MDNLNYDHLNAYALGYYDGRAKGSDEFNPYAGDDPLRHLYNAGYERGVADYCEEEHGDEEGR
jgi:hypothetical protein